MNRDNQNIIQSDAGLAIGKPIQREVLQPARAQCGKGILATLSQELSDKFGTGCSYSALTRMVKFAEVFSEGEILATVSQQWKWTLNYGKFWRK